MERFLHRESVLLGYSPEKSNPNSSSPYRNPHRNSDIDFNDVFGGPPRRSVQEMRHSFGEASDSYGFGGDNGPEASLNPWSGLSEKPVFGEEGVTGRRYPSADFFDDIYRNNSSISSPRKHDKDPFSSTPGSRVLSPARPLPPKAEPFGSFFPAQFSLPAKLPKGIDLPTFGSTHRSLYRNRDAVSNAASNYSYSPLSRFSDQGNHGQEELRNDFQSSYNENVLSQELPLGNNEPSSGTENDGEDTGTNPRRDLVNPKVLKSGSKFHFSIYNWASKGVPLVMPLRGGRGSGSKENAMMERSSSYHGRIENERMADGLPGKSCDVDRSANDRISTNMKPCREPFSKSETLSGCHGAVNDVAIDTISFHRGEEEKSHSLSEIGLCGNSEKEISMVTSEARESELKPLSLLFNDDDEQGIDKVTRKDGRKESKTKVTKKSYVEVDVNKSNKKPDGEKTSLGGGGVHKANFQGSLSSRDLGKSSFNGKVREFVKFLNQEASLQTNVDLDTRSQSFRLNARGTARAENVTGISKTTTDETTLFPSKQEKAPSSAAPIMVDENSRFSDRHHATLKNTNHMSNGASGQKDNPAPSAAPIPDGPKVIPGAIDDSFQIKEITQDGNKVTQTSNNRQELQAIDAKIRKWSSGRERNIRSLLSTLQYVLWPECGWKPLPLVDIIEGTAVKRSYQKALLCLHPDKLQQKGAASHQKYIAEKVFDILQEAWTHFNSLASL